MMMWHAWMFPMMNGGFGWWSLMMIPFFLFMFIFPLMWIGRMFFGWNPRHHHNGDRHHGDYKSALEILDEEYAKGNVSDEDYKTRKANLLDH